MQWLKTRWQQNLKTRIWIIVIQECDNRKTFFHGDVLIM